MINSEFLIVSYIVGMFIDWIFQWSWQAENKSKWSKDDNKLFSLFAVICHSLIYALLTTAIVSIVCSLNNKSRLILSIVLFISHAIIDTRIPVKWIMYFKGMKKSQIEDYLNYGFMHIGIDHRLHEITLFILSFFMEVK